MRKLLPNMNNNEILEKRINYFFRDKKLLETALTHSSYASEHGISYEMNNERLEFIGDGYLDAIIGNWLFDIMKESHEGTLSRDRADVVREESLADVARGIGLGEFILLGRGEESNGGRDKDSILSDAFEAVLGAIIVDSGFNSLKSVIYQLFENKVEQAVEGKLNKDYKSRLQEQLQEKYKTVRIKYVLTSESGPDHNKTFNVNVELDGKVLGSGSGKSKSKAEQAAACDVLSKGEI